MANVRNSNTFFIDTQYSVSADELEEKNILVTYVILTTSNTNAELVLKDAITSGATKIPLKEAASGVTRVFDFSECPIHFPNGVRPTTVTNAVATVVFRQNKA